MGKLVPLPIPQQPWSHLGVDFMTDLPKSQNFTCVLVVVDWFSKGCKMFSLTKLPTTFETAEALFNQVFRNFGIPEDIVSDRGPQLISKYGRLSSNSSGSLSACLQDTTLKLMARLSIRSKKSVATSVPTATKTRSAGAAIFPGLNTPRIPFDNPPQGSPPFSVFWVTNLLFSPGLVSPAVVPAVDYWFHHGERIWDSAYVHLQQALRRHKDQFNRHHFNPPQYQPGQNLWLSTQDIRLRQPWRKLSPCYIGPFTVQRQLN